MRFDVKFKESDRGFTVSFGGGGGGWDEGYNAAVKALCPSINESGLFVQCRPLAGQPFKAVGAAAVTICGKNLYNKNSYPLDTNGYPYGSESASKGTFSTSQNYRRTGFIPVAHLAGQTIVLSHCPFATNPGMAFYTRIPNVSDSSDSKSACCGGTTGASIQVPADAVYMVFCVKAADKDADVQIEIGNVTTEYEPYKSMTAASFASPLDGVSMNSVFSLDGSTAHNVTVSGKTDPVAEIAYLNSKLASLSGAAVQANIE